MNTAIWVAIIGGVSTLTAVSIPLIVTYVNRKMDKNERECEKKLAEMNIRLMEVEEDRDKAIKLAVEQYKNRSL